eukprot:TRINITY_DN597_c2_g1_i1.p2 TRINITY_DN597_c2_g1~~TRINITY_DN597_c2_g1_i1.p2  ORF type:complete len:553 (-),score=181.36 TRINITY_DN597_c2_g1_i1:69-1727(-)
MAARSFFDGLPPDLTREEKDLRSAVLGLATNIAKCLGTAGSDGAPMTSLQEWVDRRMPGEVQLYVNSKGKIVCASRPKPPKGEGKGKDGKGKDRTMSTREFLDSLPQGDFLPEELRLREAIISKIPPGPMGMTMRDLVSAVRFDMKFMPVSVALGDWIDFRIGGEVKKTEDRSGQLVCTLLVDPPQEAFRGGGGGGGPEADFDKVDRGEQKRLAADDFFNSLPDDALTEDEQVLREHLFEFLAQWGGPDKPHISKAGGMKEVQAARHKLLPKGVGLKEWVERRIGGEIVLDIDPRDRNPGFMRATAAGQRALNDAKRRVGGAPGGDKPEKGKGKGKEEGKGKDAASKGKGESKGSKSEAKGSKSKSDKGDRTPEDVEDAKGRAEEAREEFFAALPTDELTPAEQDMRALLLDWLEDRPFLASGTLSQVGSDPKLREAKHNLLPAGSAVTIRAWIDRRIGGEVETVQDDALGSKETYVGRAGEISVEALKRSLAEKGSGKGGASRPGESGGKSGGGSKKSKGGGGKGKAGVLPGKRKAESAPSLGKFAKRARR